MPAKTPAKLRVTVLAGGPSAERDISLASGQAIAAGLDQRGHEVFISDIGPDDLAGLDHPADVVFPALHGTFGEDGTLQRIMEERGITFVGSGSRASATAMDKVATKQLAEKLGVPTPPYEVVSPPAKPVLSPPVVVKPIAEGSSVATSIVHEASKLDEAIAAAARQSGGSALVEQFVAGDELTIGFLGSEALPPIRIRPDREFYDFVAKYRDDHTEYLFDTGRSQSLLDQAAELSRRVFEGLGCRHLGRVDWIADADDRLWFLEVNTIPGFTNHSLVPKAAEKIGIPFDELVERLVYMAMEDRA